jgi:hypothetical protein
LKQWGDLLKQLEKPLVWAAPPGWIGTTYAASAG